MARVKIHSRGVVFFLFYMYGSSFKGSLVGFRMRFLRGGNLRECCGVRVRGSFRFSGKEVQLLSELWSLFGLMVLLGDIILYIPGLAVSPRVVILLSSVGEVPGRGSCAVPWFVTNGVLRIIW
ncbi:hypothetical protein Rs2_24945 [Raphanus sativus]|nr:hypothetical protein Rs2_24945 [Raphanus sativus]